jgi:hypothetical protein
VEFGFRGRFSVVVEADDDFCGILRHLLTAQSNATPSEGSWPRATLLWQSAASWASSAFNWLHFL